MTLRSPSPGKPRIGELLLSEGRISEETLSRALTLQSQDGKGTRLGAVLLKWDLLAEQDLLEALSRYHRCPSADRDALAGADRKAVALLSADQAARLSAMPYAFEDKAVRVAFADPSNLAAVDEVKAITGRRVVPAVTSQVRLVQAHQRFYSRVVTMDLWTIVQKLERKRRQPVVSAPASSALPDLAPDSSPDASEAQAQPAPAAVGASVGTAADEIVEELTDPISEEDFETIALAHARGRVVDIRIEVEDNRKPKESRELDPFSDDCPLAKFVEDALNFFAGDSDLSNVLETLEEPVEELDTPTQEPASRSGSHQAAGDSTIPRARPGPGPSY